MNREEIIKVIDKLIGEYVAIGETNYDDKANENLSVLLDVLDYYIDKVLKISENYLEIEYSKKQNGELAYRFIDDINNRCIDTLNYIRDELQK